MVENRGLLHARNVQNRAPFQGTRSAVSIESLAAADGHFDKPTLEHMSRLARRLLVEVEAWRESRSDLDAIARQWVRP